MLRRFGPLPECPSLNIVFVASEVAPFAKTGGLADVCGALPIELARQGHNVAVMMPAYRQVKQSGQPIEPLGVKFDIPIGNKIVRGRLLRSVLPGSDVPIFFVEQDDYFDRPDSIASKAKTTKTTASGSSSSAARARADPPLESAGRYRPLPRLADRPDSRLSARSNTCIARLRKDRVAADHPQHGLPGDLLALGHAADRARLEVLQLATRWSSTAS
jgi:hypothetical protein